MTIVMSEMPTDRLGLDRRERQSMEIGNLCSPTVAPVDLQFVLRNGQADDANEWSWERSIFVGDSRRRTSAWSSLWYYFLLHHSSIDSFKPMEVYFLEDIQIEDVWFLSSINLFWINDRWDRVGSRWSNFWSTFTLSLSVTSHYDRQLLYIFIYVYVYIACLHPTAMFAFRHPRSRLAFGSIDLSFWLVVGCCMLWMITTIYRIHC